ncbi:MAG: exonuclease domain-containing protein [Deltaproteobacteria bacterium]|nr:exonuclease domain-containing protein [Deltaproteobacteria bacterium]
MNIWEARWLVIDTETTGIDTTTAAIVELAAVPFDRGRPGARMGRLINPGIPIPEQASAVHGITDAMVARESRIEDVAERFLDHVDEAEVLVGYNFLCYDEPILSRSLGVAWDEATAGKPVIDPLVIVRLDAVGRYWRGPGRHRLTSVCARLGIRCPGQAHRASADCLMTGALLWHLRTHPGCQHLPVDAHEADAWLHRQAAAQEENYQRWRASQPPQSGGGA